MNNVIKNTNDIFGELTTIIKEDGTVLFKANDILRSLGYSEGNWRSTLSRKCRCVSKCNVPHPQNKNKEIEMNFIPEGDVYRLIVSSKLPSAEKFESWVFDEVLPTIRKTGGYINNDDLFINIYLPFADEQTKALFSTTLATVRKQNEIIESQKDEIIHKQEIINGLTDDVDIYKKKDVINRICKHRNGNYANRYKELYKCFKENFHIDLEARCEGYNLKQNRKKDQLSVIKYAEQFGYIDDLYSCCTKLFEAEIDEVLDQINIIHSK